MEIPKKEVGITGKQKEKFCSVVCQTRFNSKKNYYKHKNDEGFKEKQRIKFRKWKNENRERHNAMMRKVYRDNKKKYKTRQKTLAKIGIPEGLICQNCHNKPATERHHFDYSKPMDILFVCKDCNEKLPSKEPKNLNIT